MSNARWLISLAIAILLMAWLITAGVARQQEAEKKRRQELIAQQDREEEVRKERESEAQAQKVQEEKDRLEQEWNRREDRKCVKNQSCRTACQNRCFAREYCPGAKY